MQIESLNDNFVLYWLLLFFIFEETKNKYFSYLIAIIIHGKINAVPSNGLLNFIRK